MSLAAICSQYCAFGLAWIRVEGFGDFTTRFEYGGMRPTPFRPDVAAVENVRATKDFRFK